MFTLRHVSLQEKGVVGKDVEGEEQELRLELLELGERRFVF